MNQIYSAGEWWLPQDDSIKIKGNLKFNPDDGGTLTLESEGNRFIDLDRKKQDFFLLGELEDGKKITGYISFVSKWNENITADTYNIICVLQIKYILLNVLIINERELKDLIFKNIMITFTNLDNWFYKYDLIGKDIEINIKAECNITIAYRDSKFIFKVESLKEKTLEHYIGLKYVLQGFFNFISTDKPVMVESFNAKLSDLNQDTEIMYRSTIREPMVKVAVKRPFLFRHDEIKEKFKDILNKWFEFYQNKDVILDLYFALMYNNDIPLSMRFLSLFQALEVYHASFMENTSAKKKERQERIAKMLNVINTISNNDNAKNYLNILIKERNYPSLTERLREIYDKYKNIFPHLTTKFKDKESFIKNITDYRHRLTHGGLSYNELSKDRDFFGKSKIWN